MKKLLIAAFTIVFALVSAMEEEHKENFNQTEQECLASLPSSPTDFFNDPISAIDMDKRISNDVKVNLNKILMGDGTKDGNSLQTAKEFLAALDVKFEIKNIKNIKITQDNKFLVVQTLIKVFIIELEAAKIIRIITHKDNINCVKLTKDSKYIATASNDGMAKLYNLKTDEEKTIDHAGRITSLEFSSDNKFAYIYSEDRTSTVCHLFEDYLISFTLKTDYKIIFAKITSDNKNIITVCLNGTLNIYDVDLNQNFELDKGSDEIIKNIQLNLYDSQDTLRNWANSCEITPDNKFVLLRFTKQVKIFDIENKTLWDILSFQISDFSMEILDNKFIQFDWKDILDEMIVSIKKFYDIEKKKFAIQVNTNRACKFKKGTKQIIFQNNNSLLIKNLCSEETVELSQNIPIKTFKTSTDDKYLIVFLQNKTFKIYNLEDNSVVFDKDLTPFQMQNQVINDGNNNIFGNVFQEAAQPAVAQNPALQNNAFGLGNWMQNNEEDNNNFFGIFGGNTTPIPIIIFSEDSKYVIINWHNKLMIIDMQNQLELLTKDHDNRLILLVTDNNELIIGHRLNGKIEVFNLTKKATTVIQKESAQDIASLQEIFIHKNKYLAAKYDRENIRIYDLNTNQLIHTLPNTNNYDENAKILTIDKYLISKNNENINIHRFDKSILHKLAPIQVKLIIWLHDQKLLLEEEGAENNIVLNKAKLKIFNSLPPYVQHALVDNYNLQISTHD